ncbi:MAG: hypothetical protein ACXVIJ_08750 [Thermoanaerobaculia bacterium]
MDDLLVLLASKRIHVMVGWRTSEAGGMVVCSPASVGVHENFAFMNAL